MHETRTVETCGKFENLESLLISETPTEIIHPRTIDHHRLYHPHRHPRAHEFRTNCPHQFRLDRRQTKKLIPMRKSSSGQPEEVIEDELVIHLSESVHEMYPDWTMYWEFGIPDPNGNTDSDNDDDTDDDTEGIYGIFTEPIVTPYSDSAEWKTIVVGKTRDILYLLEQKPTFEDTLEFKVSWSLSEFDKTQRELDGLKKAMTQTQNALLESFKQPSIDITQLIFRSKRNGAVKRLYVPTSILIQFEYFQKCHSPEYSESRNVETSHLETTERLKLEEGLYCDDSDEEWDSDSDDPQPPKNAKFKATIHVKDTARQTYKAFIDYAICGALYFSPRRSEYQEYYDTFYDLDGGRFPGTLWPHWAERRCKPHTIVPGFKTLASPRSLYRLADMLIIPELKAACRNHILNFLRVETVISELKTPLFEQHEELRVEVYKFMREHWQSFESSQLVPFITSLSKEEGGLVFTHILQYVYNSSFIFES